MLYCTAFFKAKNFVTLFFLSFVWFISGERISLGVIFPGGNFLGGKFPGRAFIGGMFIGENFLGGNFPDIFVAIFSHVFLLVYKFTALNYLFRVAYHTIFVFIMRIWVNTYKTRKMEKKKLGSEDVCLDENFQSRVLFLFFFFLLGKGGGGSSIFDRILRTIQLLWI